jgi:hypothetical protein
MDAPGDLPRLPRFRFEDETLEELLGEWKKIGLELLEDVKKTVRERPTECVMAAFMTGLILGALKGRRR